MKKLFETVKAWLRSRVTAMKSEKGRVKSEKVTEKKTSRKQPISVASETFPLRGNKKGAALTLPEVQAVLCHKYELRYNLLSEQSEYRRHRPVEELFFRHYRLPHEGEAPTLLSAAHIYEHLTHCDARLMKNVCAQTFGKVLRGLGAVRSEHHDRRVYAVIPVE